jgi:tRNA A-37 threonylcarbamoyl transferase component Bud32
VDVVDPLVGTEIAGYTVESVLGRGGMGIVYVARQRSPDRRVALKLIDPAMSGNATFRERFLREARAAAAIEHPHILPVYDAGDVDGVLYISMRLVHGHDLATLLRDEAPLVVERAAEIVAQVGSALDAAHARGLVHRDVKPGNVLVTTGPDGEFCYLMDFGVSAWTTEAAPTITGTGQMVGTLSYVAPEQIDGSRSGPAADIYSLGCVLFECLTGRPPFAGRNAAGTLYAHLNDRPPDVSSLRPQLPRSVDAAVGRALEKDPAARYASARELAQDLRAASSSAAREVTVATAARPARREHRRRSFVAAIVGLVAVAAFVAIGLLVADRLGGTPSGDGAQGPGPQLIRSGVQVTASSTAPSSTDGAGNVVTYVPANVIDGDVETAWRAPGDGHGVTLTLLFDNPVDVARIGLIPGYAKSDPATGVNRFEQNRIVRAVRYELPGRPPIDQELKPEAVRQSVRVGATTTRITIEIESTTPPGGGPRFDYTAISEVYVYGFEA